MNILITNDDGIDFIGLKALAQVFSQMGDVYVVAPEGERSSHSHHLNIRGRLRYEEREFPYAKKAFALWGTPADCVHLGMQVLIPEKIDLVVSGINRGCNVSTDIVYSGTVAAAREAFIYQTPSMALSLEKGDIDDYVMAAEYGMKIVSAYLDSGEKEDYFLNVNVPNRKKEDILGIRACHKTARIHYGDVYTLEKEEDRDYVVMGQSDISYEGDSEDIDIDLFAVKKGYVSISAMGNEQLSRDHSPVLREMLEKALKSGIFE